MSKKITDKINKKSSKSSCGKIKHKITEINGIKFHSKMESRYYEKLIKDKADGKIKDFRLQPKYLLLEKYILVEGRTVHGSDKEFTKLKKKYNAETIRAIHYISDFEIDELDGTITVVDTKGKSTADFEIKRKLFMALNPTLKFKVLIEDSKTKEWVNYYEYTNAKKRKKKKSK